MWGVLAYSYAYETFENKMAIYTYHCPISKRDNLIEALYNSICDKETGLSLSIYVIDLDFSIDICSIDVENVFNVYNNVGDNQSTILFKLSKRLSMYNTKNCTSCKFKYLVEYIDKKVDERIGNLLERKQEKRKKDIDNVTKQIKELETKLEQLEEKTEIVDDFDKRLEALEEKDDAKLDALGEKDDD